MFNKERERLEENIRKARRRAEEIVKKKNQKVLQGWAMISGKNCLTFIYKMLD